MVNATDLINDSGFLEDCARYAEQILTRDQIKRKYPHLSEADWDALGTDEMVAAIDLERTRRIRSGVCAREKAQLIHATKSIDVLDKILSTDVNSPRVRIESARELARAATPLPEIGPGPGSRALYHSNRFISRNWGTDEILTFNKSRATAPHDDVDTTSLPRPPEEKIKW
jgi:hypothetical protein